MGEGGVVILSVTVTENDTAGVHSLSRSLVALITPSAESHTKHAAVEIFSQNAVITFMAEYIENTTRVSYNEGFLKRI